MVALILLLVVLVNFTPVQNFLAQKAASILSNKLKTTVSIKHVRIDFLNHLVIEGLYIEDQAKDTLLYAGKAEVRISDWFFVKKDKPVLHYIGLHNAYGHLYRTNKSDIWNYQFVVDAFDTGKPNKDTTKTRDEFELDLKKLDIHNVRFHMDDAWVGSDIDLDIGDVQLDADQLDIKKKRIDINSLAVEDFAIYLNEYIGGRPPKAKVAKLADTTAFNTGGWIAQVKNVSLKNCAFNLKSNDKAPAANEFDPAHLGITNIDIDVDDILIKGDTILANLKHLTAQERSGFVVKELKAKVTVSSVASICDELYLETNNSIIRDYYAMHYHRFTDFKDYIDFVRMEAHFKNSSVDAHDVAYFAPALREYPTILKISGNVFGSVTDLEGTNLFISDGISTIKGDLRMTGLPDIDFTFIDYRNGELFTTGAGILKYAPSLRNNPNIAIEKLSHAYFKGSYKGYIESFAANGVFITNLGTIRSDVTLTMPQFSNARATYSGTISTENFNLGALIRQPDLGTLSFKSTVKGTSFDPALAQIDIDATIGHITYRGYEYKNIFAEGVLAKKHFDGKLLIDDPNLAMAFNGSFDFNDDLPKINATANVLASNLQALKLTKDSVLLTADFDLNATASNIDDFIGYAKLYNINLVRNNHRLDVDSIYVNSLLEDGQKLLIVESNDVTARIKGNFELSSLPYSFQYYISGYLPNYIKAPTEAAPPQDISFTLTTRVIDSILGVIAPAVTGFDNTVVNGSLNTIEQRLTLDLRSASGSIGNVHMYDINLDGKGNFQRLTVNGTVQNIVVGDSIMNGSLSVNTSLGNDSLLFKIATTSAGDYGTATLNGQAYASGDSLYLTMLPSEFYLNKNRWEIPTGSNIIFSDSFLYVRDLNIQSGLQHIRVNSKDEFTNQSVVIAMENLDIQQLGALLNFDEYEPEGRINGELQVDRVFKGQFYTAKINATGVKLGNDTLGNVIVNGSYDLPKDMLYLDPQSGIYRGAASINVYGNIRTDSTSMQQLDGGFRFTNAPLSWTQSILAGFLSNINGVVNGEVALTGTGITPILAGKITLSDVTTKVDFLGVTYRIPSAEITIDEKKIDIGEVTIYDPSNNTAILTGSVTHQRFDKMRLSFAMKASEFNVIDLKEHESSVFYGNLTAKVDRFNLTGPPNNMRIDITATPLKESHLFLPVDQGSDIGTYSYIGFKTYGQEQVVTPRKNTNKVTLIINANLTPDGEITMVIDPTSGDAINAKGYGNIKMNIPIGGDISMYGDYILEEGDYTFTFKQLFFKRKFVLDAGSRISFRGPIGQTALNVNGTYTTKARLYDLLNEIEKQPNYLSSQDVADAKLPQNIDVKLHMDGSLDEPKLSFNLDLQERRSVGTYAFAKFENLNQNERELFDQVASLLLINTFISPQGLGGGGTAISGAINNVSDIISSSASSQLTNIVNKLLGNPDLSIDLKYKNYNLSDPSSYGVNRNEVTLGVTQSLLKDRLVVEVGGTYDWGRPASSSANSNTFNLAGDFRLQWLLTDNGALRLNLFRTNTYDVLVDQNVARGGIGLSWRKTFDGLDEFFRNNNKRKKPIGPEPDVTDTTKKTVGNL